MKNFVNENQAGEPTYADLLRSLVEIEKVARENSVLFDTKHPLEKVFAFGRRVDGFFVGLYQETMPAEFFSFLLDWRSMVILVRRGSLGKEDYCEFIEANLEIFKDLQLNDEFTCADMIRALTKYEETARGLDMILEPRDKVCCCEGEFGFKGVCLELMAKKIPSDFYDFLHDWKSMVVLLKKGSITENIYATFINKGLDAFTDVPILSI